MKYCTILARLITQIVLYNAIKVQDPQYVHMCDVKPLAEPIKTNFYFRLVLLICIPYVCRFYRKIGINKGILGEILSSGEKLLTLRVGALVLVKIIMGAIYGEFQIWFVLKNCLMQLLLLSACVGIDTFSFYSSEAAQIIFIDPFLMTLTIYETSESFCYRFPLFHLDLNLLVLCISAIEGFAFVQTKANTIYTKQDAYRLLMTTIIFSIMYSLFSINTFHYKYALSILTCCPLMILAMIKFKQARFKTSLFFMTLMVTLILLIRRIVTEVQKNQQISVLN